MPLAALALGLIEGTFATALDYARQLHCLLGPAADLGARAFDAWLAATA